jgi:Zn-dependent protease with chaperone function
VRLNTANSSFVTLVAFALVPYALIGVFCCGALSLLAYRVSTDGVSVLTDDWRIWPAIGFFAIVGAGTIRALWSVRSQLRATDQLARHVRSSQLEPCHKLESAAAAAGVEDRVVLVDEERAFSFTFGFLRPRVAVSRGLVDLTSTDELSATLEHERYHVGNLDPLKVVIARAAGPALFYLPVLRDLRRRYVTGRELAADRRAARACGPQPLAGALYKVSSGPRWSELGAAAAIGADDLLELRVTQLETGREPPIPQTSRAALAASVAALGLLGAGLTFSLATLGDAATVFTMSNGTSSSDAGMNALGMLGCVALWSAVAWVIARRVIGARCA